MIPARVLPSTGTPPVDKFEAGYFGIVVSNSDPMHQNRVTLNIPQVLGTAASNWAQPIAMPPNSVVPTVGSVVIVKFAGGDRNVPVYSPLSWLTANGPLQITVATTSTQAIGINVTGDTNERLSIHGDGGLYWGPGNGASDTNFSRTGIGQLTGSGTIVANSGLQTFGALSSFIGNSTSPAINVTTLFDANNRFYIEGTGKHWWGAGGATAVDTNLYRSAVNTLRTDDSMIVTGTLVVNSGTSSVNGATTSAVFVITNSTSAPGSPLLQVRTAAAADRAVGIGVTGDADNRFASDSNGQLSWGSGAVARDTNLYRPAANTLATDDTFVPVNVVANVGAGSPETWHAFTLQNSWVNSTLGPNFQYRLVASPPNSVEIIGDLTAGTTTDGTIIATLPVGYRPSTQQQVYVIVIGTNATANMRFFVSTTGNIESEGMSALTTPRVFVHAFISLDA